MMIKKLSITELNRLSTDEFKETEKIDLVVVLDNVRSRNNIGSIFRTSDAFLVHTVYLCGISDTPPNPEIHKTALGAEESISWKYVESTLEAVEQLKREDYTICAIEQAKGSVMLTDFTPQQGKKYAIILGNEVHGVQQSVIDQCDVCIELPQYGTKHSLNVSVTAGIVIWELSKTMLNR